MCMQDVEEESVGKRNAATVRRGTGSKRSRAADVHNLSERVSKYWSSFYLHSSILFFGDPCR